MHNRRASMIWVVRGLATCFVFWSLAFIYRSSAIAIDGKRYFCLFDDAMISMRYAWNFSSGAGLVWNAGERIEGYSNFLMTLVMSVATLIFDKSSAALAIQVLGIVVAIAIAFRAMQIANLLVSSDSAHRHSILILSFVCALGYYPLAFWTLMGMETGLLAFLLLSGVYFALKHTQTNEPGQLLLTAISLGLAFLTRPDSLIFTVIIFSYVAVESSGSRGVKSAISQMVTPLIVYLIFLGGQEAFRWAYYGDLLPNTYYLKLTGMSSLMRIRNGFGFVTPFLLTIAFPLIVVIVDLMLNFHKRTLFLLVLVLAAIFYQIWIGGDPWTYWRLIAPVMPILFLLFVKAVFSMTSYFSGAASYARAAIARPIMPPRFVLEAVIAVTFVALILANSGFMQEIYFIARPYTAVDNESCINTAIALNELTTEKATVGVTSAGTIPYYTGKAAIDFLGKNDAYVARLSPDVSGRAAWNGMESVPGHNKFDLNYSIKVLRPTYVQVVGWLGQDLSAWSETHYEKISYKGTSLRLLRNSDAVRWERIHPIADTARSSILN
ncbi:MAG TPA: hypothetical protein DEP53_03970 [Bacteroidetes bacterium]|nr:hypothetical protein [Bacteroidota bacterium]